MRRKDVVYITREALAAALGRADGAHVVGVWHDYDTDTIKIGFLDGTTGFATPEGARPFGSPGVASSTPTANRQPPADGIRGAD